jgi:hypothetical protein
MKYFTMENKETRVRKDSTYCRPERSDNKKYFLVEHRRQTQSVGGDKINLNRRQPGDPILEECAQSKKRCVYE